LIFLLLSLIATDFAVVVVMMHLSLFHFVSVFTVFVFRSKIYFVVCLACCIVVLYASNLRISNGLYFSKKLVECCMPKY
jgi:hypothetical protein